MPVPAVLNPPNGLLAAVVVAVPNNGLPAPNVDVLPPNSPVDCCDEPNKDGPADDAAVPNPKN